MQEERYRHTDVVNPNPATVLIVGVGKLGGPVLDALATRYPTHEFVCVARNENRLALRVKLAQYVAAQWGSYPEVKYEPVNVNDVAAMADLLRRTRPAIVFNATTPFPWWKVDDLPRDAGKLAAQAGPGMWGAIDCILPLRLADAIQLSGVKATYVNACYPDMVNVFLSGHACGPQLGIGNLSNLVPGLQLAFADELRLAPRRIRIQLVAHHAVSWNAPRRNVTSRAPFHLTVTSPMGGRSFAAPDYSCFEILRKWATRTRGVEGLAVTVGSATTVLTGLLDGSEQQLHCPGVHGLPGGYPVIIGAHGQIRLDLPESLTLEEAVDINRSAQSFDGIEHVEPGRMVATTSAREAYASVLGKSLDDVTLANIDLDVRDTLDRLESRYDLRLGAL